MKHLPVGGSTIARSLACTGWRTEAAKWARGGGRSNRYADLGNLVHNVLQAYYDENISFEHQLLEGVSYNGIVLTQDIIDDHCIPCQLQTDWALAEYQVARYYCEPFVQYVPDVCGGSVDMLCFSADGKTAMILDFKTGKAKIKPTASQLKLYALAARTDPATVCEFAEVETFVSCIIQPRVYSAPAIYEYDLEELLYFQVGVDECLVAEEVLVKGPHCSWCPASGRCAATRKVDDIPPTLLALC